MAEYIEREAAIASIYNVLREKADEKDSLAHFSLRVLAEILKRAPTSDVVEVVRCKDCQFYKRDTDYCKKRNKGYCYWDNTIKTRTHFCGYGKKKEGAEK